MCTDLFENYIQGRSEILATEFRKLWLGKRVLRQIRAVNCCYAVGTRGF